MGWLSLSSPFGILLCGCVQRSSLLHLPFVPQLLIGTSPFFESQLGISVLRQLARWHSIIHGAHLFLCLLFVSVLLMACGRSAGSASTVVELNCGRYLLARVVSK